MYCPKCGREDPDNGEACSSCGCVLEPSATMPPETQARTSKLAVLSLALGFLSLPFFVLAGLLTMIVAIVGIVRISGSRGRLKGVPLALSGMILSVLMMCVFVFLWRVDAPPIPNDYTLADLRSAPAECAESFEILKTLIDENWSLPGAPAVGLTKEDVKMLDDLSEVIKDKTPSDISESLGEYAAQINQAWDRAEKARDTIRRLNEFPEIADLSEPIAGRREMRWGNFLKLARLYEIRAYLQTEQDDILTFTAELIELDSVFRKIGLNARPFIERLICHLCLQADTGAANVLVNNPSTSRDTVERLAKHFAPLSGEQLSMRNGVLFEYLLAKNIVLDISHQSPAEKTRFLKTNSTLCVYKNCHDDWLDAMQPNGHVTTRLSAWPDHYPFKEPDPLPTRGSLPLLYRCYNPVGSRCISTFGLFYNVKPKKASTILVHSDLFQIVLNKRLGKEVSLKARAYSDEYIVDVENKKIFSPGPDGKPGTKDDIKLSINPELLGW